MAKITPSRISTAIFKKTLSSKEVVWENQDQKIVMVGDQAVKLFPSTEIMTQEMDDSRLPAVLQELPFATMTIHYDPRIDTERNLAMVNTLPEGVFLKPEGENNGPHASILDTIAQALVKQFDPDIVKDVYVYNLASDKPVVYFLSIALLKK